MLGRKNSSRPRVPLGTGTYAATPPAAHSRTVAGVSNDWAPPVVRMRAHDRSTRSHRVPPSPCRPSATQAPEGTAGHAVLGEAPRETAPAYCRVLLRGTRPDHRSTEVPLSWE